MSSQFFSDSIFWVETDKIKPNPYQPRKEFDELKLKDLAESIKQYGVLQPLVVTRNEIVKEDGILVEYELISGERRLRASKIAGIPQVPVVIRSKDESDLMKLELAIIENLQREDLNAVDRAEAFRQLADQFGLKHIQIAQKMGKSREYVSNSLRILLLPQHMLLALREGKISEGHTRPLLMLLDRKDEQETLFKEILYKKMTVRDAELIARKIAFDKARKKEIIIDPEITSLEQKFTDSLGTRVHIEKGQNGGKITIDFFSNEDLRAILDMVENQKKRKVDELLNKHITEVGEIKPVVEEAPIDDRSAEEKKADEENEDMYSVKNFSL
ncbi:MAG: ParB/RepB/Spo0J family partition protein [Candidatus Paceibacterota bacterium]|jgi:ParB family chromosome partitioning protein